MRLQHTCVFLPTLNEYVPNSDGPCGACAEEKYHDHEADVDDSKPLPRREGLNPSGPKFF